jgi:hypothetical protein
MFMKTLKNMKGIKPLPKQKQKKITGGDSTSEGFSEDSSKPRPPLLIIAG